MISVRFQGNPFNITEIQVYAQISNAEEAEVEWFYQDLQDLLELIPLKDVVHHRGLECKSRKSRDTWSIGQIWPWVPRGKGGCRYRRRGRCGPGLEIDAQEEAGAFGGAQGAPL